jgi:vacuolar-type H+-ATPase subunit H
VEQVADKVDDAVDNAQGEASTAAEAAKSDAADATEQAKTDADAAADKTTKANRRQSWYKRVSTSFKKLVSTVNK